MREIKNGRRQWMGQWCGDGANGRGDGEGWTVQKETLLGRNS